MSGLQEFRRLYRVQSICIKRLIDSLYASLLSSCRKNHPNTPLVAIHYVMSLCNGHSALRLSHSTIHSLWNLHRHSNRASSSPTSYSTIQIEHSCALPSSPTQSFSVAVNGNMWIRFEDPLSYPSSPWYVASRDRMHAMICSSRALSSPSAPRSGSALRQIGQMSVSLNRGRAAVMNGFCDARVAAGRVSSINDTPRGRYDVV